MFVKRLINWVAGWGGPLGTASGQQIPMPVSPIIEQTKMVTPDAALQISAVFACVELLAQTISTLPLYVYRDTADGGLRGPLRACSQEWSCRRGAVGRRLRGLCCTTARRLRRLEGIKKARRWCDADCRDAWAKEHEHE
nr:MAG TPA: Portal Protein [Caudoviricetes sp.]